MDDWNLKKKEIDDFKNNIKENTKLQKTGTKKDKKNKHSEFAQKMVAM